MDQAAASARRRANYNIHPTLDDPVQRFFNAMHPGTYVRPHRHTTPLRWEMFLVLKGRLAVLQFDGVGRVVERQELVAGGPVFGAELEAGCWHTLVVLEPALVFELKEGPYSAMSDKDFARWAPAEGDAGCEQVVSWYETAGKGDPFPRF
jgi:cupin fold WbuC family metalloprotein